jgi:hypothetical protein
MLLLRPAIDPVASALVMEVRPELKGERGASDNNDQIAVWDTDGRNGRLDDIEGYQLEALLDANIEKGQGIIQQLDQLKDFQVYEVKYVPAQAGLFTKSHYLTGLGRATIWHPDPDQNLSKYYVDIPILEERGGSYLGYDNSTKLFSIDERAISLFSRLRTNLRSIKPVETLQQQQPDPEKETLDYRLSAIVYDGRGTLAFGKVEVSKILTIKQGRDMLFRFVVMGGPGIAFLGYPIKLPNIELLLEEESEFQNQISLNQKNI